MEKKIQTTTLVWGIYVPLEDPFLDSSLMASECSRFRALLDFYSVEVHYIPTRAFVHDCVEASHAHHSPSSRIYIVVSLNRGIQQRPPNIVIPIIENHA